MKEQNVQYQIEIKRLKENIKFATDKAIAEKDKRKLGEVIMLTIYNESTSHKTFHKIGFCAGQRK